MGKLKKRKKIVTTAFASILSASLVISSVHAKNIFDDLNEVIENIMTQIDSKEYTLLQKVLNRTDDSLIGSGGDTAVEAIDKYIFIGDSRTEDLRDVNSNANSVFQCSSSMGYSWMVNTAFPAVDSQVASGTAVIILMGVNDVYNINNYISAINKKAAVWSERGANIYFASVGPVDHDDYVTDSEVVDFNATMHKNLTNADFIDLYGYLKGNGYKTVDGLHYDSSTSKKILSYLRKEIGNSSGNSGAGSTSGNKVWWSSENRESTLLTYQMTNWTAFTGMGVTLYSDSKITARLSDDLKPYVKKMEDAAVKYGFAAYKELFKTIAEYRHIPGDPDIFRIVDTGLNPYKDEEPGKAPQITSNESIDIASKLFASCIRAANFPAVNDTKKLKAVLQGFEFENEGYIVFCDYIYTLENAEEYASRLCGSKLRTNEEEIRSKGRYDYRDQKFPDKVLKYYSVIDINNGNLSGSAQQLLTEAMGSWPSYMDERRKAVIEKGISLYGKVTYSMDQRLQPSMDNPRYLDCSSFVGWSFYYAGIKDVLPHWTTGNFVDGSSFRGIGHDELIPGDVGLKNTIASGGSNHVGIYLGKSASGQDVWLHCTTSEGFSGVHINTYGNFRIFYRHKSFVDNLGDGILGG